MVNDWDIAFSNSGQESNILLNSSKMMKITKYEIFNQRKFIVPCCLDLLNLLLILG